MDFAFETTSMWRREDFIRKRRCVFLKWYLVYISHPYTITLSLIYFLSNCLRCTSIWSGQGGYSYLYEPWWWIGMITSKFVTLPVLSHDEACSTIISSAFFLLTLYGLWKKHVDTWCCDMWDSTVMFIVCYVLFSATCGWWYAKRCLRKKEKYIEVTR